MRVVALLSWSLVACRGKTPPECPACEAAPEADPYAEALEDAMDPRPSELVADLLALTPA